MKKAYKILIIDLLVLMWCVGWVCGSFHTVDTQEIIDKIFTIEVHDITNYNEYHYEKGFNMPVIEL